MSYMTCCAFWFSTLSVSFMMFSFLAPFWLGRLDLGVAYYYALWYNLQCFEKDCTLFSDTFDSPTVPLIDRYWSAELVIIPVLVTIGLILAVLSLLILEIMKCCAYRRSHRESRYYKSKCIIIICTILLFLSGIALVIACIVGIYAASEYYKDNSLNHAAEFPWCLLSLIIGAILVLIGAVLYLFILCRWHDYADHYDFRRWSSKQDLHSSGHYKGSDSKYETNYRETNRQTSSYSVPAFSYPPLALSNSIGMSSSLVGKGSNSALNSKYRDDKLRRSNIIRSTSELGMSRRSLHDSPKGFSGSNMRVYVEEHDDYLDRLRKSRSQADFDAYKSSSAYVPVRESHYSAFSFPKSEPGVRPPLEPSVLDILYKESKKSTHL